eukprot:scaffold2314_cov126-Skeletonema_dohrnii-CCMP3373.AAC.2
MAVKRELAASHLASSGHLRCCSDADTDNQYLSKAVDRDIHNVRYDMAVDCGACSVSPGLIRSPAML